MKNARTRTASSRLLVLAAVAMAGCSGASRAEGLDASKMPEPVSRDYEVFAQRCSKCHSLARPLQSGIEDDGFWALYVARMRRQPGSGISLGDTTIILRFLHYYSEEQKRAKGRAAEPPPSLALPPVTVDAGEPVR
jgi:hypothetical protein